MGGEQHASSALDSAASEDERYWAISPVAMLVVDGTGAIRRVNEALLRLTGYERDAILGESIEMLVPDAHRAAHVDRRRSYTEAPDSRQMGVNRDLHLQRADGSCIAVEVGLAPARGGVVAVVADIDARKRAENELRAKTRELETVNRELAQSNRELEQFAFIVSHDLQQPLRMVSSFMGLVARRYTDQLDEQGQKWIGFAVDGANRMKHLLDDVLAMSRVGRHDAQPTLVELSAAVETARSNLPVGEATIEVGDLPKVMGHEMQLVQVFQNLISNALKFKRAEPPSIRITTAQEDGAVRVTVADDGIGMDAQHVERIFEPFKRLHERHEYDGSGIGLAIVAKIMAVHGGRAHAESTLGEGSRFHLSFPLPRARDVAP